MLCINSRDKIGCREKKISNARFHHLTLTATILFIYFSVCCRWKGQLVQGAGPEAYRGEWDLRGAVPGPWQ